LKTRSKSAYGRKWDFEVPQPKRHHSTPAEFLQ
jgi:hypothetical protein